MAVYPITALSIIPPTEKEISHDHISRDQRYKQHNLYRTAASRDIPNYAARDDQKLQARLCHRHRRLCQPRKSGRYRLLLRPDQTAQENPVLRRSLVTNYSHPDGWLFFTRLNKRSKLVKKIIIRRLTFLLRIKSINAI